MSANEMKIIGHRGAAGLAAENSLAAIKKAIEAGVDAIEVDVRVTDDGRAVLSHNQRPLSANISLPALTDAIAYVNRRVPLIVEIKPGEQVEPVAKIIKDFIKQGWKTSDFLVGSFSQSVLQQFHNLAPDIPLAVIESWSGIKARYRAKKLGAKKIIMNHKWLWGGFIAAMGVGGYELYTYTLNNPVKAQRWQKFGLRGVITDYPDRFKR